MALSTDPEGATSCPPTSPPPREKNTDSTTIPAISATSTTTTTATTTTTSNETSRPTTSTPHRHLHGRDFYNSIGAPRYILAPMVDHSHLAWRILCRRHAPAPPPHPPTSPSANLPDHPTPPFLAYSPMFHSRNFTSSPAYILQNMPSASPKDPYGLDGHPDYDRPLVVQFCSNVPGDLLNGVRAVRGHTDAVDLNLGCPQGIAKKGHYGAFLQEHWGLIHDLLSTSAKAREEEQLAAEPSTTSSSTTTTTTTITTTPPPLPTQPLPPITAKIRIQSTPQKTLEYAQMVLSTDITWLCVHGRTRDQKGHNTGLASWPSIRALRHSLPPSTVLFANGNLLWPGDAARCLAFTGADGVMSAEGALFNPTGIFRDPDVDSPDKLFPRMDKVAREYLDILRELIVSEIPSPQLHPTSPQPPSLTAPVLDPNLGPVKSHLFKLLHCLLPRHTAIRAMLAKARPYVKGNRDGVDPLRDFENVVREVERVTLEELDRNPEVLAEDGGGWVGPVKRKVEGKMVEGVWIDGGWEWVDVPWYRCQPNVRVLPEEAVRRGAMAWVPGTEGAKGAGKKKRKRGEGDVGGAESAGKTTGDVEVVEETGPEVAMDDAAATVPQIPAEEQHVTPPKQACEDCF